MFLKDVQQTNYSAVDKVLIKEIYKDLYQQRLRNENRFSINTLKVLTSTEEKVYTGYGEVQKWHNGRTRRVQLVMTDFVYNFK